MNNQEKECVFCDIAQKIGKMIVDIEPLNPVVKGHRIVFHSRHSSDFADDIGITMEVIGRASEIAKETGGEFNLITSKGVNATQSVFHLHVHLVPRKENDGLKLPWTNQEKILVKYLEAISKAIASLAKEIETTDKDELLRFARLVAKELARIRRREMDNTSDFEIKKELLGKQTND